MPLRFAKPASQTYRYPLLIKQLLASTLSVRGNQEIIYRDQFRYTYVDFYERVKKLATVLTENGTEQGSTVAVLDWDSHRYLEAYFAIPMMGAVMQTANVRLAPDILAYTLNHAEAEVLLVHRDFFPLVEAILPNLPKVKNVIAIMDGAEGDIPSWASGEYEALSAAASSNFEFEDFDENAIASIFHTSGTTGKPKAVCYSHRQLVLYTLSVCAAFGSGNNSPEFGCDDVYMPLTPMFHVHAWAVPYISTMLGIKQVYPGRYDPDMICRLRAEHGVTFSHCVPTVLQLVLAAAERTGTDLNGWKLIIGGSALTKALWTAGHKQGLFLNSGYGMSETGPGVTCSRPRDKNRSEEELASDLTLAGPPLPLVHIRIVDEQMNMLPADGSARGELVVRSPWTTPCYVGNDEASEELWHGGWLHTQDVATIDQGGILRICDRLKDVIKTGGEWVDSVQLEEIVATAEGVAEASVVAVPDPHWGERPLAVIVARKGVEVTLEQLNTPVLEAISRSEITRYAKLDRFVVVEELPRTTIGKIDKKLLRTQFSAEG